MRLAIALALFFSIAAGTAGAQAALATSSVRVLVVRGEQVSFTHVRSDRLSAALARLRANPANDIVELDRRRMPAQGEADPLRPAQWGLRALGWDPDILPSTAAPLAIVDSGFDVAHPDLRNGTTTRFAAVHNAVDGSQNVTDLDGHGTTVASIAGAGLGDGGIVGVAPHAPMLGIRISDDDGHMYVSSEVAAIRWAVANGARVINLSLGSTIPSLAERDAIIDATKAGALVVAAAGNSGCAGTSPPEYPAAYPEVLAVAATEEGGAVACYSSGGSYVDVAAPGSAIIGAHPGNQYVTADGTSFSAPHAAAVAALILGAHPSWTPAEVKRGMEQTATDLPPTGVDERSGYGLLNLPAALALKAPPPLPEPPAESVASPTSAVTTAAPAPIVATPPVPASPAPSTPATPAPSRPIRDALEPNGMLGRGTTGRVAFDLVLRRRATVTARVSFASDPVDMYRLRSVGTARLRIRVEGRATTSGSRIDVVRRARRRGTEVVCAGGVRSSFTCRTSGSVWIRVVARRGSTAYRVTVSR